MNALTRFLIRFSFILLGFSMHGQNGRPCHTTLGTAEGIPSPETYYAMQASDGKMWFGTDNGAFSYDGYEIKSYSNKKGLNNSVVFQISEDHKHQLWFNTMSGNVYTYSEKDDSFIPYKYNHILKSAIHNLKFAQDIQYDSKTKTLYSITNNKGIFRVDSVGNLFHFNSIEKNILDELKKDKNLSLDTIYGKNQQKLIVEIKGDFKIRRYFYLHTIFPYFQVMDFKTDESLILENSTKLSYVFQNQVQWTKELPFVSSIINYKDGIFYFPTIFHKGLLTASLDDIKNNNFHTLIPDISSSFIKFQGKNSFWLCTQNDGIFYFPNDKITICADPQLPTHLNLRSIFKSNNKIFISDILNRVYEIDFDTHKIKNYHQVPQRSNNPNDLYYDATRKTLWYGPYYYQNDQWNLAIGKKKEYSISGYSKSQISQDSNTLLIVGKNNFGKINLETHSFSFLSDEDSDYLDRTLCIFEDTENHLWIGNTKGLFLWKNNHAEKIDLPILNTRIEDIKQLQDSTLVIATKGDGIVLLKNQHTQSITIEDGLTSDLIENIAIDSSGNIWVGTMRGLNYIEINENTPRIQNITIDDGLPTNEIYKIIPGDPTWIATSKGLVKLENLSYHSKIKKPIINKIYSNDEIQINKTQFDYNQNNIFIFFSTIDYNLRNHLEYRYRLNPTSTHWIKTNHRKVHLLGLSPQKYRFEVQSKNNLNIWSPSTIYDFKINKPFWQTWIFTIFVILLTSGIGFWYFLKLKREHLLTQRIAELEKQALQAQINPHFIFNVLNAIQSSMLQNDIEKANRHLSRFAKLIRSTLHFVTAPYITLEEEIESLKNYLSIEQMRFENAFDFTMNVNTNPPPHSIYIPPMIIQPFVENAIQHGISSNSKKGKITISMILENDFLLVKITDNGIGISNTTNQSDHPSVGMSITKRRLELINGNEKNKAFVQIMDSKNNSKTTGTIVQLKIMIKK